MQTSYILVGLAILALVLSSNDQGKTPAGVQGGARPAGGGALGPGSPLPAQAPSGSPGGQTMGASVLGALATNADKIGAGISNIIDAARATDDGSDDGAEAAVTTSDWHPPLAIDGSSGSSSPVFQDIDWGSFTGPGGYQGTAYDQVVPDFT